MNKVQCKRLSTIPFNGATSAKCNLKEEATIKQDKQNYISCIAFKTFGVGEVIFLIKCHE